MFLLGHLGLTLVLARWLRPLVWADRRFPISLLLVGALLPDLIDKPLGHAILGWDNGRLWAHTLLFAATLLLAAVLAGSRRTGALGAGTMLHQLLDQAWADPVSWLWPLAGPFPAGVSAGAPDWIQALASDPFIWSTEALGLLGLIVFLVLPKLGLAARWWDQPAPSQPLATLDVAQHEPERGP